MLYEKIPNSDYWIIIIIKKLQERTWLPQFQKVSRSTLKLETETQRVIITPWF